MGRELRQEASWHQRLRARGGPQGRSMRACIMNIWNLIEHGHNGAV